MTHTATSLHYKKDRPTQHHSLETPTLHSCLSLSVSLSFSLTHSPSFSAHSSSFYYFLSTFIALSLSPLSPSSLQYEMIVLCYCIFQADKEREKENWGCRGCAGVTVLDVHADGIFPAFASAALARPRNPERSSPPPSPLQFLNGGSGAVG